MKERAIELHPVIESKVVYREEQNRRAEIDRPIFRTRMRAGRKATPYELGWAAYKNARGVRKNHSVISRQDRLNHLHTQQVKHRMMRRSAEFLPVSLSSGR